MNEEIKAATKKSVGYILDEIKRQRQAANVSVQEAARWAGVSEEAYLRMESGLEELPFDAYCSVAKGLGIHPTHLMKRSMKPMRLC